MTHRISYASAPEQSRHGGLIAFGVISIVIGSLSGCVALAVPLPLFMHNMRPPGAAPAPDVSTVVAALILYGVFATAFIWIGVGSCKCRRWVRPIVLCVAWPSLVMGILSAVMWLALLPVIAPTLAPPPGAGPTMPPAFFKVVLIIMSIVFLMFYILIPAAYVWFYRRPQVQAVLDFYDPEPSWTDAVPLPVLGLSIWLGLAALFALTTLLRLAVPFFGICLTGVPAAAIIVAVSALMAYAAYASYRTRRIGWWIAILMAVLMPVSTAITVARIGLIGFYRAAGYSQLQLDQMTKLPIDKSGLVLGVIALFSLPPILYLLYVQRFFRAHPAS